MLHTPCKQFLWKSEEEIRNISLDTLKRELFTLGASFSKRKIYQSSKRKKIMVGIWERETEALRLRQGFRDNVLALDMMIA